MGQQRVLSFILRTKCPKTKQPELSGVSDGVEVVPAHPSGLFSPLSGCPAEEPAESFLLLVSLRHLQ